MSGLVKIEMGMVGGAVAGFVVLSLVGWSLHVRGVVRAPEDMQRFMFPYLMGLFLVFGLGMIGLGLHVFVVMQGQIGNSELGPIAFLRRSETGVTVGAWAFLLLGASVAFPAMRRDMVGSTPSVGPSKGVLRADIGMTLEQVRAVSTLPMAAELRIALDNSSQLSGREVFDLEIEGAAGHARFEQCRYYFMTTGAKGDPRIDSINVGISPFKRPRRESEADEAEVRRRLAEVGWTPGRFVYRTEKDIKLNGGATTAGEGRYWAKGRTLLILSSRRMDDPRPGEDPRLAGEFILFIDLVPRDRTSYATLEYGPVSEAAAPAGGVK
jgi:hypothetical protein